MQLGKLLRTAFLADYFINDAFRRELRRVLNRGEAVNALKRAIYSGRVAPMQARRNDEMQAVADALSLLANIIMAWNTSQMQPALDHWPRRQRVPPELISRIAPTRLEGINLRGVFRFPVERYAARCSRHNRYRKHAPRDDIARIGAVPMPSNDQQKAELHQSLGAPATHSRLDSYRGRLHRKQEAPPSHAAGRASPGRLGSRQAASLEERLTHSPPVKSRRSPVSFTEVPRFLTIVNRCT